MLQWRDFSRELVLNKMLRLGTRSIQWVTLWRMLCPPPPLLLHGLLQQQAILPAVHPLDALI